MAREQLINDFLTQAGWIDAESKPLAGDASNRRYERLKHPVFGAAVLMDAPPEKGEDTRPFVQITELLRDAEYSAPEILGSDTTNGFLLLEDLGDALYARVCTQSPELETPLYEAAVDLLASSHKRIKPPQNLPPYDLQTYKRELSLVTEWYLPNASLLQGSVAITKQYSDIATELYSDLAETRSVVVLRDYHAENLLWLPDRQSQARVGLLDYQDALAGHPTYDLVSLLEDARRDTDRALQEAMLARFISASGREEMKFRSDYAALGAQRNLKILGIFARLCCRDGKPAYLDFMPRVWAHLMHDLEHPALAELRQWVLINMPEPTSEVRTRFARASA